MLVCLLRHCRIVEQPNERDYGFYLFSGDVFVGETTGEKKMSGSALASHPDGNISMCDRCSTISTLVGIFWFSLAAQRQKIR